MVMYVQVLAADDLDQDGELSYPEFMAGRRRGDTVIWSDTGHWTVPWKSLLLKRAYSDKSGTVFLLDHPL